jgi:hypothetical protein
MVPVPLIREEATKKAEGSAEKYISLGAEASTVRTD